MFAPLVCLLAVACVPEPPNTKVAAETGDSVGSGESVRPPAQDLATHAAELLAQKFSASGEAAHVSSVVVEDGLIRVSLDLVIRTLGDSDVYTRVCNALAPLIGSTAEPAIAGVQTFAPDGRPIVATASATARCAKFYR
jgi:hypothetical protein